MTPGNPEFHNFYEEQAQARRLLSQQQIWDRCTQPAAILLGLFLLLNFLYSIYGSSPLLEQAASRCWAHLWDGLVFVTPAQLLSTLDDRMNPLPFPRPMNDTQLSTHAAKSEMMRRIVGLDRAGGMMASVLQARSRALSVTGTALGLTLDTDRPAGLGNRDNSCYQNSILQGLAALRPVHQYLSTYLRAINSEANDKDVARTLRTLLSELSDLANNGKTLWTPSLLKSMSTWTQQDAQEYYSKILDDIDKGVAKAAAASQVQQGLEAEGVKDDTTSSQYSDDSGYQSVSGSAKTSDSKPLQNPLDGLLAQRVACVHCGYSDGLSMIPFNCLTLSLGLDKSQHDLYDRLDAYSKVEAIEGVECPKCTLLKAKRLLTKLVDRMTEASTPQEKLAEPLRRLRAVEDALEDDAFDDKTMGETCKITAQGKVNTTKTKQIVIARPPQSLAIHVNRSVFNPATFDMMKNSAPVQFPMTLDLGPWCLGSAQDATESVDDDTGGPEHEVEEEHWLLDARKSMVAGDSGPSKLTGPIYELRAAVTHYGRHENGHYICYRKHPRAVRAAPAPNDDPDSAYPIDEGIDDDSAPQEAKAEAEPVPLKEVELDWWRLSDHNVTKVDEETVMGLTSGVFMLFYECVDPSIVLQSEPAEAPRHGVAEPKGNHGGGDAAATAFVQDHLGQLPAGAENTVPLHGGEQDGGSGGPGLLMPESVPLPPGDDDDLKE